MKDDLDKKDDNHNVNVNVDGITKSFRNIAILLLLFIVITDAVYLFYHEVSDDGNGKKKLLNTFLELYYSISVSFIPPLFVVIFIKPIYNHVDRIRNILRAPSRFEKSLDSKIETLSQDLQGVHALVGSPSQVSGFYSSYNDLKWDELLQKAEKVTLAALWWSDDWMDQNLPIFEKALEEKCEINMIFPSPKVKKEHSGSDAYVRIGTSEQYKILNSISRVSALKNKTGSDKLSIKLANEPINYMIANLTYDDREEFMYSPFLNSNSPTSGKPPVVSIDKSRVKDIGLKKYIDSEMEQLSQSRSLPDFWESRHLTWSDDSLRIIVSIRLSCPAPCSFCYVGSMGLDLKSDEIALDCRGLLLANAILMDKNFQSGLSGTTIMLGGFSDPFQHKNIEHTMALIEEIRGRGCTNIIHVATRYCISDSKYIEKIKNDSGIVINYSVTSTDGKLTLGEASVKKRFDQMKEFSDLKANAALYIRPIIPGVTINQIPELIKLAREAKVTTATVGGLYVDKRITKKLNDDGVKLENDETNLKQKKFVLANNDELKKVDSDESVIIQKMLEDEGFNVFSSSSEVSDYFRQLARDV